LVRDEPRCASAGAALPERLPVLLALYYDEGLTYREIAKSMGVSEPRLPAPLRRDEAAALAGWE